MAYRPTDGHTHMVTLKDMSHAHTHRKTADLHSQINSYYYIRHIFRFNMLRVELGCIIFLSSSTTQLGSAFNVIRVPQVFAFLNAVLHWTFPQTQTPLRSSLCTEITNSTRAYNHFIHPPPVFSFLLIIGETSSLFTLWASSSGRSWVEFKQIHICRPCWGC